MHLVFVPLRSYSFVLLLFGTMTLSVLIGKCSVGPTWAGHGQFFFVVNDPNI